MSTPVKLRLGHARVLRALYPEDDCAPIDRPTLTRAQLCEAAGFAITSGSITRALNGIRAGSSSGAPHAGLLDLGLVEEITLDVDGLSETLYRISDLGIEVYESIVSPVGALPEMRERSICINRRYCTEE